jgi:hypothetical protein
MKHKIRGSGEVIFLVFLVSFAFWMLSDYIGDSEFDKAKSQVPVPDQYQINLTDMLAGMPFSSSTIRSVSTPNCLRAIFGGIREICKIRNN